jgi:hypothetical protein
MELSIINIGYGQWAIGYRKARKNKQRMKQHLKQWEKKNEKSSID